jgi:hypothetical protein
VPGTVTSELPGGSARASFTLETGLNSHTALPLANPAVIFRALAEGGVIFSTVDEVYFGLNTVGARVWELLPPATATMDELIDKLAGEYPEVEADVIRADVTELLDELARHNLVIAPAAGNGTGTTPAEGVSTAFAR